MTLCPVAYLLTHNSPASTVNSVDTHSHFQHICENHWSCITSALQTPCSWIRCATSGMSSLSCKPAKQIFVLKLCIRQTSFHVHICKHVEDPCHSSNEGSHAAVPLFILYPSHRCSLSRPYCPLWQAAYPVLAMGQPAAILLAMDAMYDHTAVTTPGKQQQLLHVITHNNSKHI